MSFESQQSNLNPGGSEIELLALISNARVIFYGQPTCTKNIHYSFSEAHSPKLWTLSQRHEHEVILRTKVVGMSRGIPVLI